MIHLCERLDFLAVLPLALSGYLGQGGGENCLALFQSSAVPAERGKGRERQKWKGGKKGETGRQREKETERDLAQCVS